MVHRLADVEKLYALVSRVVIATDKSPGIIKGARYTARMFPRARYFLINVINITDRAIILTGEYENTLRKMGQEAIETIRRILVSEGVSFIEHEIQKGKPSVRILRYARRVGADLIVLSTHSKIGSQALGLGATSRIIIEKTRIPVLLFSPMCREREPRVILNPSSGSKYSFKASMLAVRLAHALGAELITLYIGHEDVETKFHLVRDYAKKMGVKYTVMVARGKPDEEILRHSENADLMVVSRGRPGLGYKFRFLDRELALGKVEREVLGMARIPIMVIPD